MLRVLGPSRSAKKATSEILLISQHYEQPNTTLWIRCNGQTFSYTPCSQYCHAPTVQINQALIDLSKTNACPCTCTSKSS